MIIALGLCLAAGLLLILAPWLAPTREVAAPARSGRVARILEEAGYPATRGGAVALGSVAAAVVVAALAWLVSAVPVVSVLAGLAAAAAPWAWLRGRGRRRQVARRALWPDVCDHLVGAVRAGMAVPDALASLAVSAPDALRPAFAAFSRDVSASGHVDTALDNLKSHLADPMADRIVETVRMARRVGGGELTAVLRALSSSIRADVALRGEVEARQSWVRGAAVVGLVAPWVVLVMLSLRPESSQAYASAEGVAVVLGGGAVSLVAYRLMIRAGRLPAPRRWLR